MPHQPPTSRAHQVGMTLPYPQLPTWFEANTVLIAILVIRVAIEAAFQGADFGLWGSPWWRGLAYQDGTFWREFLDNWQPNCTAQPTTMFTSYGFLYVGVLHLLVNMITLACQSCRGSCRREESPCKVEGYASRTSFQFVKVGVV